MPEIQETLTPMLRQYLEIKQQHQDAILFFRLGDFYEMFFEDAVKASQILEITLTSRNKNAEESVPLCGVPYHSASAYIRKLIEQGCKVAICEQVEDPKLAKGIVKREVTRVVTPGLLVETESLASHEANYLAAAVQNEGKIFLSLIDISTGEVLSGEYSEEVAAIEEMGKLRVRELLILHDQEKFSFVERLKTQIPNLLLSYSFEEPATSLLQSLSISESFIASFPSITPGLQKVLLRLLDYVQKTQRSLLNHLGEIQTIKVPQFMGIDARTFRHLELIHNQRGEGSRHTLFWVLNKTQTSMGARALKRWIHYPLVEIPLLKKRQEGIQELLDKVSLLQSIQSELQPVQDIERMLGKLAVGSVNARDLYGLASSLKGADELIKRLRPQLESELLRENFVNYPDLHLLFDSILQTLRTELPHSIREGGMIAEGVHSELDELRSISRDGKSVIAAMEEEERARTKISSLKIRYNKVFGYYIEITHAHKDNVPLDYIRKQTLTNAERFITPKLKEYENKVLGAEERIKALEYEIFCEIRAACAEKIELVRQAASAIALLDVMAALASCAREYQYVRPELCEEKLLDLKEARHPVLERIPLGERFIPNDLQIDEVNGPLFLITGPNMAGKSTVMRQAALIVLMAQIGSYVPAKEARIGVVDQIFSRIGASDDLSQGQSTFMVEMLETASILRAATEKSFVVLDEIGRGTSTYDGISIAWAIAEHLAKEVKCRALFATHYHELTELAGSIPGIKNFQIAVKEWNNQILFLRKLISGGASRSYGIEVARLAGFPEALLVRAREVLKQLEDIEGKALEGLNVSKPPEPQLGLFNFPYAELLQEISQISPDQMSPLEALNFLFKLKEKYS